MSTDNQQIDWQARYDTLLNALYRAAEERDWCDEFDEFLEINGLPSRHQPVASTSPVTGTFGAVYSRSHDGERVTVRDIPITADSPSDCLCGVDIPNREVLNTLRRHLGVPQSQQIWLHSWWLIRCSVPQTLPLSTTTSSTSTFF